MSLIETIKNKFSQSVAQELAHDGMLTIVVEKSSLFEVMKFLKENDEIPFNGLLDLCGVDYIGRDPRFEVVYHLYSLKKLARIRVKVKVSEKELTVHSVNALWGAANWFEREAYDMFGITFENHPNLKRLLMWE